MTNLMIKADSVNNRHLKRLWEHIVYLLILLVLIPGFLYFEVFVVLPVVTEQWSMQYLIHLFNALFLLLNIVGNLIFGVFTNTSIRGKLLSSFSDEGWSFCDSCKCSRPPRAWHCDTCNTCILKRDHHCTFFACCVGYYNLRYFMLFTMHVFIAMVYAFVMNIKFVPHILSWNNGLIIINFLFPLAAIFLDSGDESFYVLILVVNAIVGIFTGYLFCYHLKNLLRGSTTPEIKHCTEHLYDRGWKRNLVEVFGSRWYLTWLCPFVRSSLPGNGIEWIEEDKYK